MSRTPPRHALAFSASFSWSRNRYARADSSATEWSPTSSGAILLPLELLLTGPYGLAPVLSRASTTNCSMVAPNAPYPATKKPPTFYFGFTMRVSRSWLVQYSETVKLFIALLPHLFPHPTLYYWWWDGAVDVAYFSENRSVFSTTLMLILAFIPCGSNENRWT